MRIFNLKIAVLMFASHMAAPIARAAENEATQIQCRVTLLLPGPPNSDRTVYIETRPIRFAAPLESVMFRFDARVPDDLNFLAFKSFAGYFYFHESGIVSGELRLYRGASTSSGFDVVGKSNFESRGISMPVTKGLSFKAIATPTTAEDGEYNDAISLKCVTE